MLKATVGYTLVSKHFPAFLEDPAAAAASVRTSAFMNRTWGEIESTKRVG